MGEDWAQVDPLIRQDFSPEQTAHRLKQEGRLQISHETIYQLIYADKRSGGDPHQFCAARNLAACDTPEGSSDAVRPIPS
ncbi:MAG: hypothetical protein HOP04_12245 [Methylophilaceae bacterium]|nr:hypothetical protein [Methylophilaceae bacterium]